MTHLRRYTLLYLAFAIGLLLASPIARGIVACSSVRAPGGCPHVGEGK